MTSWPPGFADRPHAALCPLESVNTWVHAMSFEDFHSVRQTGFVSPKKCSDKELAGILSERDAPQGIWFIANNWHGKAVQLMDRHVAGLEFDVLDILPVEMRRRIGGPREMLLDEKVGLTSYWQLFTVVERDLGAHALPRRKQLKLAAALSNSREAHWLSQRCQVYRGNECGLFGATAGAEKWMATDIEPLGTVVSVFLTYPEESLGVPLGICKNIKRLMQKLYSNHCGGLLKLPNDAWPLPRNPHYRSVQSRYPEMTESFLERTKAIKERHASSLNSGRSSFLGLPG